MGWNKCASANFSTKAVFIKFQIVIYYRNMFGNYFFKDGSSVCHRYRLWVNMLVFSFIKIELYVIDQIIFDFQQLVKSSAVQSVAVSILRMI